jgi:hypothetical protein
MIGFRAFHANVSEPWESRILAHPLLSFNSSYAAVAARACISTHDLKIAVNRGVPKRCDMSARWQIFWQIISSCCEFSSRGLHAR